MLTSAASSSEIAVDIRKNIDSAKNIFLRFVFFFYFFLKIFKAAYTSTSINVHYCVLQHNVVFFIYTTVVIIIISNSMSYCGQVVDK